MVLLPGPPGREAGAALNPPIDAKMPVPGDASVKYVQGPRGPSKASTSIRVSKLTVTAGGVPVMIQRYRLYVDALHGRTHRCWLLATARSRPRITFRGCSGVAASCPFPRVASRTFS